MPPGNCCDSYAKTSAFLALGASVHYDHLLSAAAFTQITRFTVGPPGRHRLIVSSGSVVDFVHPRGAIVNAANEACLGGRGVDGAINGAGGPDLERDRRALAPLLAGEGGGGVEREVRCPTGGAVTTGPGTYGRLGVPYVIHAVGPNYRLFGNDYDGVERGDELLASAYRESLERAKEVGLEAVAFGLISSGTYCGRRGKREVLTIGVRAIRDYDGYDGLGEVHMCAFDPSDVGVLLAIAAEEGLKEE